MRSLLLSSLAIALLATGCSQTQELTDRVAPPPPPAPALVADADEPDEVGAGMRDVMLEGVSILGTWYAVQVFEDAEATRDLEVGMMEMTLLVLPGGRSTLTGVDRREGVGRVSFTGIIEGNHISFHGMEGDGMLSMSGRHIILRDPRGRSTVYEQGPGN